MIKSVTSYSALIAESKPGKIIASIDFGFRYTREGIPLYFPYMDRENIVAGDELFVEILDDAKSQWAARSGRIENRYWYDAKVLSVYDADTVRLNVYKPGGGKFCNMPFRLSGIDAPEIRGVERPEGLVAKSFLSDLIIGRHIRINTEKDKSGKYGRYLATIYLDGENINKLLIDSGYAEPYE